MMKFILTSLLLITAFQVCSAQSTSGVVKDSQGDFLHFAFVQNEHNQGVFTDSLGNFTIQTSPNSKIKINCIGYHDTTMVVNGNENNLTVVLSGALTVNDKVTNNSKSINEANQDIMRRSFSDATELQNSVSANFTVAQGDLLPVFNPKEETQGSRYLIRGWVHGYVINSKGQIIQNPIFSFSYDKMGGGLLLSKDRRTAIELDRDLVKYFTLIDKDNIAYIFANVPQIDAHHYVEVIFDGDKYKIYKSIKTTFEKANFSTDGVMNRGHNYDEYTDENTYYVYSVSNKTIQPIDLKRKSLKAAFAADNAKLKQYMSDHADDSIDEIYLIGLGDFMNQ